jgi:hypothetical protein
VGSIRIDESRFPLIVVTFVGSQDEAEFSAYLEGMTAFAERRLRAVTVFDATRAGPTPATQRARQGAWLKKYRSIIQEYSCGSVFVIRSPLVRGALTAILWIAPIPGAHTVVGTLEEAERWAVERLRAEGVPWPPPAARVPA